MEELRKPNIKVGALVETSNCFYNNLLGYKPEQTTLQQVSNNQWFNFAQQRGLNPNSSGIYLPRNQTAVIQEQNPLSLFHEYFGHGLYCEQSLQGRKLVGLEKTLLEEEKQEFSSRRFTLEDVQNFRRQNQTFQELDKFRKQNLAQYELFAIWTEYLLSEEHNLRDDFGMKYGSLKKQDKEAIDSIINFSIQYGNLATFYTQGMARRTTPERVRRLLEGVYGNKLKEVKFALLFGSRKEFRDIDVFSISDTLPEIDEPWLDSQVFPKEEFERRIELLDISLTDPLFSGEFVLGDETYFNFLKRKVENQPIAKEAIRHNLTRARIDYDFSKRCVPGSEVYFRSISHGKTFLRNAIALKQGRKLYTKRDLENQTFNNLRGGIKI